jgi:two-component sensor histidine kinase
VHVYHAELERDAAGQPVRAYGAVQDITERVKQQDKLQELLAQTEQDARTKGELLKEVNHRVTNNLTAVLGLLVHEKEYVSSSERNLVAPILDRLQQRIRGLLQVHRMLAQSAWAPVGVDKLAQEIIRGALSVAPWRHQAVITIKPGALKMSPRQAGGLALVLNELTTNTLKYGRQPPHSVAISLEAESHEEWATICYRDNGPGYPVEVLAGQRANVGLKLINEIVTKTLRGSLVLANDQGAVAVIRVQLEDENRT